MSIPWRMENNISRHRPAILRQRNTSVADLATRYPQKSCSTDKTGTGENKENEGPKKIVKLSRGIPKPLQQIACNSQSQNKTPVVQWQDPINTVLPNEIRYFIFEKLLFKELLICRSLSKTWKSSVETFKKFHVVIDDSKDFNGSCNIRMKTCEIQSLMAPKNRHLFQAETPDCVEIVKRISQWNVGEMTGHWTDLRSLKMSWKTLISFFLFRCCIKYPNNQQNVEPDDPAPTPEIGFLPHLEHLQLDVATAVEGDIYSVLNQNLGYLLQWHYPSLNHIAINFLDSCIRQDLLSKISSFVRFHAATLKRVDIQFSNLNRRIPKTIPQRSLLFDTDVWNWNSRSHITKGCLVKLSEYSLQCPYNNSDAEKEDDSKKWQQVLRRERDFELLIISKLQLNIRRAEYFQFYTQLYAEQLTVIELINLSVYDVEKADKMTPIDITLFGACVNLRTLGLWRAPILLNEIMPEASSEIINLFALPKSISSLTIDGLPVQSDDIVKTIQNLKHLKRFSYARAAMPRRNHLPLSGVTVTVLKALITHCRLAKIEVMTASSVPRDFYLDIENGIAPLAIENKWKIESIKQLWYNCVKLSMNRNFAFKRIP